ncbi:MAG: hypothetical protein DRZ90_07015 [Spirochaetes bacterium]|nr:MAG: hypothetical protein DRZ90_07015 [Spirochaetota bacterium]
MTLLSPFHHCCGNTPDNHVIHQEVLLQGQLGRIRDVRTGPDGFFYLLTDADNGALYRIEPKG